MRTGIWISPGNAPRDVLDAIVAAERAGIDEVWVSGEGPLPEPFSVLAAAALRTERVRLGVGVTNPYERLPIVTAWMAHTINDLCDGRFVVGLGPGSASTLESLAVGPTRPLHDCRDALHTIRRVGGVPVYVDARGEHLSRWASREGDGAFVLDVPMPALGELIGWVRSVRPVDVNLFVPVAFTEPQLEEIRARQGRALLDQSIAVRESLGVDGEALRSGEPLSDTVLGACALWGAPPSIASRLRWMAARHKPTTIGFALPAADLGASVGRAAEILHDVQSAL